uniref:Uncharacterized protein n=1 Tax=Anopheles atroparvus TaxID=41427 RepID=A0A182IYK1_ANOAO
MEMTHSTIKLNANKLTLEEGCSAPHVRRALAEKLSQRYLEQHHREADQEEQDDVRDEEGRPVQLQLARKPDYVGEGEVQAEAHSQSNSTDRSLWYTLARVVLDLAIRWTDFPVLHLHVIVRSMARQLSAVGGQGVSSEALLPRRTLIAQLEPHSEWKASFFAGSQSVRMLSNVPWASVRLSTSPSHNLLTVLSTSDLFLVPAPPGP